MDNDKNITFDSRKEVFKFKKGEVPATPVTPESVRTDQKYVRFNLKTTVYKGNADSPANVRFSHKHKMLNKEPVIPVVIDELDAYLESRNYKKPTTEQESKNFVKSIKERRDKKDKGNDGHTL